MPQTLRALWRWTALAAFATALPATVLAQQPSTSTHEQIIRFEIVSVDGNTVILRGPNGAKEFTATEDQRFNVEGKQVSVHELKPGMKGTARITTTTTVVPVKVTEVKQGEVMQASGNSIVVRTPTGIKMFSEGDIAKRNVTIVKDGQPAKLSDFHQGDKLTATIVTEGTPKVLSKREVDAVLSGAPLPPAPAPKPAAASPKPAAPAEPAPPARDVSGTPAPSGSAKKLPKTASSLPLLGAAGGLCLMLGVMLTVARRRSLS